MRQRFDGGSRTRRGAPAGDYFHGGPRRWDSTDDPEWRMLAAWVRGETPECVVGAEADAGSG
ncbi:hypothetical protein [Candidatus Palauibacter sp.]|uniref:hypothetical protein n=1 Tax=Candidatus Palauibacter sp. TaxID=3101350 RepID=UPI003B01DA41